MPFQDPVFTRHPATTLSPGSAYNIIQFIHDVAVAAGWSVDEFDTAPVIGGEEGGAELYIHPNVAGISNPPYYALKGFQGSGLDHQAIKVWMNTGYDSTKRADNQPGMYAQTKPWPTNAVSRTQVFSGSWDSGVNANPADLGMYLTAPWNASSPLSGSTPSILSSACSLHTFASSNVTAYAFYDTPLSGTCSRGITVIWYLDNTMYGLSLGHVLWDLEGTAPDNDEGHLLLAWGNVFDDKLLTNAPCPNSLAGTVNPPGATSAVCEIIRSLTSGSETFPPGTVDGTPLMDSGPVVRQQGRIEASDNLNTANISAIVRPDQDFLSTINNLQGNAFPNPRITIHREPIVGTMTQERLGFARPRQIARFPDGGAMIGNYADGSGSADWSDCGFSFPHYYAPLMLQRENDVVTEGSRQYVLFPGNISGSAPYTQAWRVAGIAFRIA